MGLCLATTSDIGDKNDLMIFGKGRRRVMIAQYRRIYKIVARRPVVYSSSLRRSGPTTGRYNLLQSTTDFTRLKTSRGRERVVFCPEQDEPPAGRPQRGSGAKPSSKGGEAPTSY
jgi:hypothetical protein